MNAELNELFRLVTNLIRFGTVAEVDYHTQRVRVQTGNNLTDWRPWLTLRAGTTQTWCPPSVGEQVILLSPEGDLMQSVVFPSVYSEQFSTPSNNPSHHTVRYPDGTVVQYDSGIHQLTAVIPNGTATVTADQVTSNAPETICTGNLTVQKNLIVNGFSAVGWDCVPAYRAFLKVHQSDLPAVNFSVDDAISNLNKLCTRLRRY